MPTTEIQGRKIIIDRFNSGEVLSDALQRHVYVRLELCNNGVANLPADVWLMDNLTRTGLYWRDNQRLVSFLLVVWFAIGFGCSIFGIEWLNEFKFGQVGLGFWIAQQGSIFVFVLIVLVYALAMDRLDRRHDMKDDR